MKECKEGLKNTFVVPELFPERIYDVLYWDCNGVHQPQATQT